MPIEDTVIIIEIRNIDSVNEYLSLGWILINQYVVNAGYDVPDQSPRFILAWQRKDSPPQHPPQKYRSE